LGDLDYKGSSQLREIISCELLVKSMVRLVECSRYEELKKKDIFEVAAFEQDKAVFDAIMSKVKKKKGWPKGKKRGEKTCR
jgi:hypothetical protein